MKESVYQKMWPHLVILGARKSSRQIGQLMGLASSYQSSTCSTLFPIRIAAHNASQQACIGYKRIA